MLLLVLQISETLRNCIDTFIYALNFEFIGAVKATDMLTSAFHL